MENIKDFFTTFLHGKIVGSIIVAILSIIIYKLVTMLLNKTERNVKLFTGNKGRTYVNLIKSSVGSVLFVITVLVILQINGVNVSSILAGVGLFGVVFGFAIQDWFKDIIRGSSIISDNYFEVGDIIKFGENEGKVLVIGLKTTKIQDLRSGNVIAIATRNIEKVEVVSKFVYVRIPVPYEVKVDTAEKAIDDIMDLVKNNKNVDNCRYLGVTELADSSIEYLLEITCNPQYKLQVRRDALKSILLGLEKHNIEVPFTQIDIHNK